MKTIFLVLAVAVISQAFQTVRVSRIRIQPLHENFGLDFVADPDVVTPKELLGEANYKDLVRRTNPDGLLVRKYDIIQRTRELKLLSILADSGLIQELEKKGLTLSKIEKLLPLIDEWNLIEFAVKNKQLVLSLAPLLIEPAPLLLPVVISALKTSPATFTSSGFALLAIGAYELLGDNGLLGITAILLGIPLTVAGSLLNSLNFQNLPEPKVSVAATPVTPSPVKKSTPPVVVAKTTAAPVQVARTADNNGGTTRRRKTVKIN